MYCICVMKPTIVFPTGYNFYSGFVSKVKVISPTAL